LFIFLRAIRLLSGGGYDLVHAIEEASFVAWLARVFGGPPYVVDIDSSMSEQIVSRFRWLRSAKKVLRWLEEIPLRRAIAAVPVCEALAGPARDKCPGETLVLPDVSLAGTSSEESGKADDLRELIGSSEPIALYVGNLEPYQGIELLLDAFALLSDGGSRAQLVIIGGAESHITAYKAYWKRINGAPVVHFVGPRPLAALEGYLRQADLLVSPRIEGVNTPMKVYSYLDSGTPVVATDLPTHNQVMTSSIARLAPPTAEGLSEAIREVIENPGDSAQMARSAREYIAQEHSLKTFGKRIEGLYGRLESQIKSSCLR
jgi:glycosyltransferase involved in cell wall biosynthesis